MSYLKFDLFILDANTFVSNSNKGLITNLS